MNELTTTQGVVSVKTTIPILSNLLVEARRRPVTNHGHGPGVECAHVVRGKVRKRRRYIPQETTELVRLLPEGEIKFQALDNHWVEVVSEKKKLQTGRMAKENFPALRQCPRTGKDSGGVTRRPDLENEIRDFDGRIALHAEWRLLILKPDTLAMVAYGRSSIALAETITNLPVSMVK